MKELQKEIWQNKVDKGFNTTDVNKEFCLLYGEVAEAYDAYRKKKDDLNEELADIAIYLMGLSEMLGFDLETEITKDITLKASWKKEDPTIEKVTIKFNSDGGSKIDDVSIEKGYNLDEIPVPTKKGYTFISWYLNGNEFSIDSKINNNITLVAKWKKINYGTFNENTDRKSVV